VHPRIAELFAHLDRERRTLDDAIGAVPAAVRATKPAPDRWSVTEIVEHLAVVEARIAAMIAKQIADAKTAGLGRETATASVMATFDANRVLDRSTRIASTHLPTGTVPLNEGLAQLDVARTQLKAALIEGDGLDLTSVSAPHRAFGQLDMYQWAAFVGSHMARHADQIREQV
jgi:hypothetical protein